LRWNYDIKLRGADAHHLATAIEAGCEEFITFDDDFLDKVEQIAPLIRVIEGHQSSYLALQESPTQEAASIESAEVDEPDNLLFDLYEQERGKRRMKKLKTDKPASEEYTRFEKLAKQLLSVPKSEIDKRQAEYEKKKAAKKRKAA